MNKYSIQLHLEKGEIDWSRNTAKEDMYIVVDQNNIDVSGQYMTLKEAKELKEELQNQE